MEPDPPPPPVDAAPADLPPAADHRVLDALWKTVAARRGADPTSSYTAALLARFPVKPAQKLAEEAAECAIEAIAGRPDALVRESADLLFHLVVLLEGAGVGAAEVFGELAARERSSAALARQRKVPRRVRARGTTKIP